MLDIVIYTKPGCNYCDMAKNLLKENNVPYIEKILDVGQEKEVGKIYVTVEELRSVVPGAKTVPQILINDKSIGGYTELREKL